MAAGEELTLSSHIQHHLTNAKMCTVDGSVAFNKACSEAGFWTWHIDTLAWSIGLGILFLWLFLLGNLDFLVFQKFPFLTVLQVLQL